MWFNVDYDILIVDFLPNNKRKRKIIDFLKVLSTPIMKLYNIWYKLRLDNLYKVEHTGQVCYLRKVLNDRFDQSQRRIYIADGTKYKRDYIYTMAEQKPNFLGKIYIHPASDYADTGVDFIVYVPGDLLNDNNYELKALINFYKEGVKRYKIEEI